MRRTIWIAALTLLVGAYLTIPAFLFDSRQEVVTLDRTDIDRLAALDKEVRACYARVSGNPEDEEAQQKLDALADEWNAIEAEGTPSYRVASQEVFFEKYQTPHIVRHIFPWFSQMGHIFRADTDESLGWLWFTLICINLAFYVHARIRAKWESDLRVVACSRWVFFCLGAMGASMISVALVNYHVPFSFLPVVSRVLSGPAHAFEQHVYRISWIWDERIILYSAIQWILLGAIGCPVLGWFKGRHLAWSIAATLAGCAILGLAVADAIPYGVFT